MGWNLEIRGSNGANFSYSSATTLSHRTKVLHIFQFLVGVDTSMKTSKLGLPSGCAKLGFHEKKMKAIKRGLQTNSVEESVVNSQSKGCLEVNFVSLCLINVYLLI